jgi:hypothetical protein
MCLAVVEGFMVETVLYLVRGNEMVDYGDMVRIRWR